MQRWIEDVKKEGRKQMEGGMEGQKRKKGGAYRGNAGKRREEVKRERR